MVSTLSKKLTLALRLCYLAGFEHVCRLIQAERKKQKVNCKFKKKPPIGYPDVIVALTESLLLYDISPHDVQKSIMNELRNIMRNMSLDGSLLHNSTLHPLLRQTKIPFKSNLEFLFCLIETMEEVQFQEVCTNYKPYSHSPFFIFPPQYNFCKAHPCFVGPHRILFKKRIKEAEANLHHFYRQLNMPENCCIKYYYINSDFCFIIHHGHVYSSHAEDSSQNNGVDIIIYRHSTHSLIINIQENHYAEILADKYASVIGNLLFNQSIWIHQSQYSLHVFNRDNIEEILTSHDINGLNRVLLSNIHYSTSYGSFSTSPPPDYEDNTTNYQRFLNSLDISDGAKVQQVSLKFIFDNFESASITLTPYLQHFALSEPQVAIIKQYLKAAGFESLNFSHSF